MYSHIIDTSEQDRSKAFIASLSKSLETFMLAKEALESTAGKLRLVSTYFALTEARLDEKVLAELPHRSQAAFDAFTKNLYQNLSSGIERLDSPLHVRLYKIATTTRAHAAIPDSLTSKCKLSSSHTFLPIADFCTDTKRFPKLLNTLLSYPENQLPTTDVASTGESTIPVYVQVECFAKSAPVMMEENALQTCGAAEILLLQGIISHYTLTCSHALTWSVIELNAKQHDVVIHAISTSAKSISEVEKLSLIAQLLSAADDISGVTAEKAIMARCLILSLQRMYPRVVQSFTVADCSQIASKDERETQSSVSVFNNLLALLRDCKTFETHCELAETVNAVLREKVKQSISVT